MFHDPIADAALIDALLATVGEGWRCTTFRIDINDPQFAEAMASRLAELIGATT